MSIGIYLDMDGTIANLYGVQDWLPKLRSYDPSPYIQAEPLLDLRILARLLNQLQKAGYTIGIISWLSKETNKGYDFAVRAAKRLWLKRHLNSVQWDEVHLVKYGQPKYRVANCNGILFDDNASVRENWSGESYPETEIIPILKRLLS